VRGVKQEVINDCDYTIEIPQFGTKHSLNVSVCAGVIMWDFYRKLILET
jgi:23S rRNA (guanosine2251-2'-O)-methyltransferase